MSDLLHEALPRWLLLAHLAATVFMTGLIWFVQVVHYPLLAGVGDTEFAIYERRHQSLTSWVVGPPILLEGATAVLLLWFRPAGIPDWSLWAGLALLAGIWLSTAFVQVPCHHRLSRGFDAAVHQRLVRTNWVRTTAWTLRALLVTWMSWACLR